MRVLAFDTGMNLGWGALGGTGPVASGTRALNGGAKRMGLTMRHADQSIRELILSQRPQVIVFASPFVGMKNGRAIQPDSIRPLMGVMAKIEEICEELKIRCIELDEPEARRAFLTAVPRRSKDIKIAVQRACFLRGWPCATDHAGDALCVAAWAHELLNPETSHETTPLFSTAKPISKRRKVTKK